MVDDTAFWAAIAALAEGLASPPGYLPDKDVFAETQRGWRTSAGTGAAELRVAQRQ
jgi:hypothetical protein